MTPGTSSAQAASRACLTRFAPSPTGEVHLGNARTALFNLLLARHGGGRFVLRIEDTDTERSSEAHTAALMADLRWLGIDWDAGPDREDARGPYRQSERGALYGGYFERLERAGRAYPCYCTTLELELSRRTQLAAGRPPRYAGTCRELGADARAARVAQGLAATLRFSVPRGERVTFVDFVHGQQSFLTDDIGDFVIRRADGRAAFFFSNAIDDAAMGVTQALRGEDHLANTPRQLLILAALGLPAPAYGHVALIVGADGAPLSKRHGATSVREYRERGYLPQAITNHLFRLGHSSAQHGLLSLEEMARAFDTAHLGRSPARFDEQQLNVWQKDAVHRLDRDAARAWLGGRAAGGARAARRGGIHRGAAAEPGAARGCARLGRYRLRGAAGARAGRGSHGAQRGQRLFRRRRRRRGSRDATDLPGIAGAVRAATGRRGAELYLPLRMALTGRAHGPELAPLLKAMPAGKARERLARFA